MIAPVAVHRRVAGLHVKERLVVDRALAGRDRRSTTIGLLVAGMVLLIFDVVVDRTTAFIVTGAVARRAPGPARRAAVRVVEDDD